jgi:hypothetical protein
VLPLYLSDYIILTLEQQHHALQLLRCLPLRRFERRCQRRHAHAKRPIDGHRLLVHGRRRNEQHTQVVELRPNLDPMDLACALFRSYCSPALGVLKRHMAGTQEMPDNVHCGSAWSFEHVLARQCLLVVH